MTADRGTITIRPATEADAPELRDYAARLFAEGLPGIFERPEPSLEDELAFIRSRIGPANSTMLVAIDGGRIVGMTEILGGSLKEDAHVGTLGLAVSAGSRGGGVGTALLEALFDWARANGVTRIQGCAWMTNPRAIALYERMGFEREGVARRAVVRDGEQIDTVMLARLLDG